MQQKEYPQIYELGLGSLVGDFFQNVKDTVSGVAKAVAPIAPYVLPFIPGGPMVQLGIGAGLGLASGQKPAEIAKNLALQTALTGVTGGFSKNVQTGASQVATGGGSKFPFLSDLGGATKEVVKDSSGFLSDIGGATKDFFTKGIGARFNPFSEASTMNPTFVKYMEEYGMDPADIIKLGIKPERGFMGQYGPLLGIASAALPFVLPKEEEEGYYIPTASERYYDDPESYKISYAADGGEMTGGVANLGQKIEHPDGKVKEHPRRIGEIAGPGTGTSDDIPAMLSDGEFVMTAQAVRNAGGGSRKEGAKNMYKLMKNLEKGGSLSEQSLGIVGRA